MTGASNDLERSSNYITKLNDFIFALVALNSSSSHNKVTWLHRNYMSTMIDALHMRITSILNEDFQDSSSKVTVSIGKAKVGNDRISIISN